MVELSERIVYVPRQFKFTCSKTAIETLKKDVKYVQS